MKIITLIDNTVYGTNLTAEHGLSLYIEAAGKKILFDTGQSGNFIKNAFVMNIDIAQIDYCLISHGHYDHTGGLKEFIKYNNNAKIHLKEECLNEKYRKKYIGIPFNKNIFEDRLVFTKNVVEITKDVFILPEIKIYSRDDTHFKNMFIKNNNDFIEDEFIDEQFLVIKNNNSLVIISGCSHRGITNIVHTAIDYFNLPIQLVLGGFHFKDDADEKIIKSIDILNGFKIKTIGLSHCTGIEKYSLLKEKLNSSVFFNYTGNILEI